VVTFMGEQATLLNISRTRALLQVHAALPVGATGQLTISHNHHHSPRGARRPRG